MGSSRGTSPTAAGGSQFLDYYAMLECAAHAPAADLRQAYFAKVREYHPDKRPNSAEGTGQRITQALNEAWEILKDPAKREVYDYVWRKEQEKLRQPSSQERADLCRHEGNELYSTAKSISKTMGPESLTKAAVALQKYQAALDKYGEGLGICSNDYRLFSNRALCYAALRDWAKCRDDALRVTQLKRDYMKGWFLYTRALWKEGSVGVALEQLDIALGILPGNSQLLMIQTEIKEDIGKKNTASPSVDQFPTLSRSRTGTSRSVSPCITPTPSRVATPPRIRRPAPPGKKVDRTHPPGQSHAPHDVTYDGTTRTAQFGDETGGFGTQPVHRPMPPQRNDHSPGASRSPGGRSPQTAGRSTSPGASYGPGSATFGEDATTFGYRESSSTPTKRRGCWTDPPSHVIQPPSDSARRF